MKRRRTAVDKFNDEVDAFYDSHFRRPVAVLVTPEQRQDLLVEASERWQGPYVGPGRGAEALFGVELVPVPESISSHVVPARRNTVDLRYKDLKADPEPRYYVKRNELAWVVHQPYMVIDREVVPGRDGWSEPEVVARFRRKKDAEEYAERRNDES